MLKKLVKKVPGSVKVASALGLKKEKPFERQFLLDILPRRSIGAEIGVHVGEFSEKILKSVSPKELNLIDPWEHQDSSVYEDAWYGGAAGGGQGELDERYESVRHKFKKHVKDGQVKIHRGYSDDILSGFADGYFDWVYVDGNHLYEFVMKDLELSLQKVKPGGFIAGDDYMEGGWWEGGVKKAVDEFVGRNQVELIDIRSRQFILKKKERN